MQMGLCSTNVCDYSEQSWLQQQSAPVSADGLKQLSRTVLNSACCRSRDITAGTLVGRTNVILDTSTPVCRPLDASDELDT